MPAKTTTTTTKNTTNRTSTRTTAGNGTPTGWNTVSANITTTNVQEACEFYQTLGFEVVSTIPGTDGGWAYAQLRLGNSNIMVSTPGPGTRSTKPGKGTTSVTLYAFVPDVDDVFQACQNLGYRTEGAPTDQFWGDRTFIVTDPFGCTWTFATHLRDVSPQEMQRALAAIGQ